MFQKSMVIILGRLHVQNTSLILRCYSNRYGFISTMAKGILRRRRKVEPPSIPDIFQMGELVAHINPKRSLSILHEWTPKHTMDTLSLTPEMLAASSAILATCEVLTRNGGDGGELFGLLSTALYSINAVESSYARSIYWSFALKALILTGFFALPEVCIGCGDKLHPAKSFTLSPMGGIMCCSCAKDYEHDETSRPIVIRGETASAVSYLAQKPYAALLRLRLSSATRDELDGTIKIMIEALAQRRVKALSNEEVWCA